MTNPKIIYLSPVSFFKGGAERSLLDLVANPHITPIIIVPAAGPIADKAAELGIPCHILPFGAINDVHRPFSFTKATKALKALWIAARQLKTIAKQEDAKIVHSNGLKAHMINVISRRLGGAKAIIHIRDIPYTKPEKAVWYILRLLSDKMVLVSRACWPGKKICGKIAIIHNGTLLVDHTITISKNNTVRLGFIGRIHPGKGLHLLIDWVAAAKEKEIKVDLSIRGIFSEDAPEYESEITQQIEALGVKNIITFTGFIDDAQKVYKDLDIVVVPSHAPDPLPRAVMESMARGIPVMGYPAGGIGEMIVDGETGFFVKDSNSFIAALNTITDGGDSLDSIKTKAKDKIAKEFSVEGLHNEVAALYQIS